MQNPFSSLRRSYDAFAMADSSFYLQNKKRKYGRDRDDDNVGRQRTPEEPEDPLKDATTLYVGNLFVDEPNFEDDLENTFRLMLYSSFYTTEEQIHELFAK